jgi:hypothetical protein
MGDTFSSTRPGLVKSRAFSNGTVNSLRLVIGLCGHAESPWLLRCAVQRYGDAACIAERQALSANECLVVP